MYSIRSDLLVVRRHGLHRAYNHVWLGWLLIGAYTLLPVDRPLINWITYLFDVAERLNVTNRWPMQVWQHLLSSFFWKRPTSYVLSCSDRVECPFKRAQDTSEITNQFQKTKWIKGYMKSSTPLKPIAKKYVICFSDFSAGMFKDFRMHFLMQ